VSEIDIDGTEGGDLPLVGTEWLLVSIEGDVVDLEGEGRAPSLVLDEDGRVSGTTGVNRLMGGYELGTTAEGDAELRLGGMATTRMAGPEVAMALEHQYLTALGTGGPYAVDGDVLTVGVLAFVGQPPAADPDA
jgi:heat shock protein HslJ